jgi:release factor glutamine methyltransferase
VTGWNGPLAQAARDLAAAGVPGAMRDARLILAHVLGLPQDRVTLHLNDAPQAHHLERFSALVTARAGRRPLSHLTGRRWFWGREFAVTPDVLDPRPETETLVAEALTHRFGRVLDLGTGSGCILLSVLADRPDATGLGIDLSPAALAVAQDNARRLGVADRAGFALSDWWAAVTGQFDLILSNPPYIAAAEMPDLAPEVRDFEPRMALTPGGDGLDAYRAIAAGARGHLAPGGRLVVEIGPTQGAAVAAMLAGAGLRDPRILPDMDGRDRVVSAQAPVGT